MMFDTKYDLAYRLISDILSQQEILLSINSGGGSIAEARIEKGLPFRIKDKWATIGDEERPWHIHLNMDEVIEARFVKEARSSDGRQSSSMTANNHYAGFGPGTVNIFRNMLGLPMILHERLLELVNHCEVIKGQYPTISKELTPIQENLQKLASALGRHIRGSHSRST